ncbi:DUF7471 family protein [Haloarchaeobius sp. TZWWS8]|uniref:DUF7471 family protein n=1 Tax=Haloarchaeobius sp. TZWWS8 TaxID=3446121 RepID=UPI003EBD38BC
MNPPFAGVTLHASATLDPMLVGILSGAALGSALLLGLGLAAYMRRRSRPYLLVALALGTIALRSVVAWVTMLGAFGPTEHHLVEHGLDVVMAALVVGAVWYARDVRRTMGVERHD